MTYREREYDLSVKHNRERQAFQRRVNSDRARIRTRQHAEREELLTQKRRDRIPVAPLRAALIQHIAETDDNWNRIALRVWPPEKNKNKGQGQVTRLKRYVGEKPHTPSTGGQGLSVSIDYDIAVRIARAAGLDLIAVGL